MIKNVLFTVALLAALVSSAAYAQEGGDGHSSSCEDQLDSSVLVELSRPPVGNKGLITKAVPFTVANLVAAYERGIFPWGEGFNNPEQRGVLFLDQVKLSKSDRDFIKKALASPDWEVTFNQRFEEVIHACATVKRYARDPATGEIRIDPVTGAPREDGVWLTPLLEQKYTELHRAGYAHSVEVLYKGELVAGLYGVMVKGVFSGESMFHWKDDAAKLGLFALIERLKAKGHTFIDTQMVLGLVKKWNGTYVSRAEYLKLLAEAQRRDPDSRF